MNIDYVGMRMVGRELFTAFKLSDAVNRAFGDMPQHRAKPEYASITLNDFDRMLQHYGHVCLPQFGLLLDEETMRQISYAAKDRLQAPGGVTAVPVLPAEKTIIIRFH